jgi:RNA polymerase subunit RPABC4/transcription elongation factor Spt4
MVKLSECEVCGHNIASTALICPNCGARNKGLATEWFKTMAKLVLIVGGIFSAMVLLCYILIR